jgi:predicted Zn-dependent protease
VPKSLLHVIPVLFTVLLALAPSSARASQLNLPPQATDGMRLMYSGQTKEAIAMFRQLEAERPGHPLGYLLEAEALWWNIYCESLERKYNTLDAWTAQRGPEDTAYLALADKAARLAESAIARQDTAEMELYAGMGYMLRARLVGLRNEKRATARAGVAARNHLLRCLQLDPNMADAYTGLGLYNYYVDTLSAFAKILRFFMGIPGGDKREGLRQLETAMAKGELTRVEARFYTAKNLRNYDEDYARATQVAAPLVSEFPNNPLFLALAGDIAAKLGRNQEAAARFRAAAAAPEEDPACAARLRQVLGEALAAVGAGQSP